MSRPKPFNPYISMAIDALVIQLEDRTLSLARHEALRRRKGRLELRYVPTRRPRG